MLLIAWMGPQALNGKFGLHEALDSLNLRFVASAPLGPSYDVAVDRSRNLAFLTVAGGVALYDISSPSSPSLLGVVIKTSGFLTDLEYDPDRQLLITVDFFGDVDLWNVSSAMTPVRLSHIDVGAPTPSAVLSGDLLLVSATNLGVRIYDVSDPSSPNLLSGLPALPYALNVGVSGNLVFIAADSGGVFIYDITDPSSPNFLSSFSNGWKALFPLPAGPYLFVAADSDGVVVLDVSSPSSPSEVGRYDTPGRAGRLSLSGSLLYVADGPGGLQVLDVSDPTSPHLLAGIPSYDGVYVMNAHPIDSLLFVAHSYHGMEIYSLSGVGMHEVSTYGYSAQIKDDVINGNYLYVLLSDGSLSVLDVSTPASPSEITRISDSLRGELLALDTVRNRLYAIARYNRSDSTVLLYIYDVSSPSSPYLTDSLLLPSDVYLSCLRVVSDTLFMCARFLSVFDVSVPSSPSPITELPLDYPQRVLKDGNLLFVLTSNRLYIYDFTSPSSPYLLDSLYVAFRVSGIEKWGNYVYTVYPKSVGDRDSVLVEVVDVSDPTSATVSGSVFLGFQDHTTLDYVATLKVVGGSLYTIYRQHLCALDLTSPSSPSLKECDFLPSSVMTSASVDGAYAYLPTDTLLRVWEVSSPVSPVFLSRSQERSYSASQFAGLYSGRLYTSDYGGSINVFDVSSLSDPLLVSRVWLSDSVAESGGANAFGVVGSRIVALYPALTLFSLSDPDTPTLVGRVDTSLIVDSSRQRVVAYSMAPVGNYVLVPFRDYLLTYDLSTLSLVSVVEADTPVRQVAISVVGDTAYVVALSYSGSYLLLYDVSDPLSPVELSRNPIGGSLNYYGALASNGEAVFMYTQKSGRVYFTSLSPGGSILDTLFLGRVPDVHGKSAHLSGNLLYAADMWGVRVYDVSDPANVSLVAYRETPALAYDVVPVGNYLLVSLYPAGLHVLQLSNVVEREERSGPERFNVDVANGRLFVNLKERSDVRIYDASGRLLYRGTLPEGRHGIKLRTGVFFLTVKGHGERKVVKVVVR